MSVHYDGCHCSCSLSCSFPFISERKEKIAVSLVKFDVLFWEAVRRDWIGGGGGGVIAVFTASDTTACLFHG